MSTVYTLIRQRFSNKEKQAKNCWICWIIKKLKNRESDGNGHETGIIPFMIVPFVMAKGVEIFDHALDAKTCFRSSLNPPKNSLFWQLYLSL